MSSRGSDYQSTQQYSMYSTAWQGQQQGQQNGNARQWQYQELDNAGQQFAGPWEPSPQMMLWSPWDMSVQPSMASNAPPPPPGGAAGASSIFNDLQAERDPHLREHNALKACTLWQKQGFCRYGDKCKYSHAANQDASITSADNTWCNSSTSVVEGGNRWQRRTKSTGMIGGGAQSSQRQPMSSSLAPCGSDMYSAYSSQPQGQLATTEWWMQNAGYQCFSSVPSAWNDPMATQQVWGRDGRTSKGKNKWDESVPRPVRISKTLTQILRHKAMDLKVTIRTDGYCRLDDVLAVSWLKDLDCTLKDVQDVVASSDKERFELLDENGETYIRASQGHSMKIVQDSQLLKQLDINDLPRCCVHGTYRKHFESIRTSGLLAGGGQGDGFRNHIHFAPFEPGDKRIISGMRYDCEVAIWIDIRKAIEDGFLFYRSKNQVILSAGDNGIIDKKYFRKAKDLRYGKLLPLDQPYQAPA